MTASLDERLAAVTAALEAGASHVPAAVRDELEALGRRAGERRRLSPEHTVVGVFGATGSGKSSLVNALVGAEVARTHVRRPTTSEALSISWSDGASELLDWLQVRERVVRDAPLDPRASTLLLLDLPDFDSIDSGNREVAERLARQVDALVWVVDPQKYADEVLHVQFIAPHARHGAVTLVVLNQIDLLPPDAVPAVVHSLQAIIENDGLQRVKVVPVSARTGDGIPALRTALGDLAAAKALQEARLTADVATATAALPSAGTVARLTPKASKALAEKLAPAVGVDLVSKAVGDSYRKRAGQATGWPLVSWVLRLRADPLTRLGLGRTRQTGDASVHRTSIPTLSAGGQAQVSLAVRDFADAAAGGLAESWRTGIRSTASAALEALPAELDLAIGRTALPSGRSWWWVLFTILQWVSILGVLAGVGWLLLAAFLPGWGFPRLEVPTVEGWAVPTLLVIGGIALGILLGLLGALLAGITGRSRRLRSRRRLLASVTDAVERVIVAPIAADLSRAEAYSAAVTVARGT